MFLWDSLDGLICRCLTRNVAVVGCERRKKVQIGCAPGDCVDYQYQQFNEEEKSSDVWWPSLSRTRAAANFETSVALPIAVSGR